MTEEKGKVLDFGRVGQGGAPAPAEEKVPEAECSPVDLAVAQIARYEAEVKAVVEKFDSMVVTDEDTAKDMTELIARAKKFKKAIEELRVEAVKPLNEEVKRVNTRAKLFTDPLEKAWKRGEGKLGQFYHNLELERRKAEKKAQEERDRLQKQLDKDAKKAKVEPVVLDDPVVPEKKTTTRTTEGTGYLKMDWEFEIVDEAQVPREYLMVDEKKIRAAVKAGTREISGVRIFEKPSAVVRT